MKRSIYRKWVDDSRDQHYLMIHPSGLMLELSFREDIYDTRVTVCQTKPTNPLNAEVFAKNKKACRKPEWDKAKRKAIDLLRGNTLNLLIGKK